MPSRSEIHKLFYLVSLDGAYDEIRISKHPGPDDLYIDATLGEYHNYWGSNTTALMVAAHHGREFAIGYLLNHGSDATLKNHEGKNALTIAMTSPGNLGAYAKIGKRGRDNICALLARNTWLDINEAYAALYCAIQHDLDYTVKTILTCHPSLQQQLEKLLKKQKRKNYNIDLKQLILHNTSFSIQDKLDSSNIKTIFSRRKHQFG